LRIFHVSAYRNSRVCPVHFTRLGKTDDWHTLQCPLGHLVDRDYASILNMLWKTTPESWTKAFWWNMKNLNKNMNWRKHEDKSNPIIPHGIVTLLQHIMENTKASEQSPAVLARGKPMNPAGGAYEGWARKPPQDGEEASKVVNELIGEVPEPRVYEILNRLVNMGFIEKVNDEYVLPRDAPNRKGMLMASREVINQR